LFANLVFTTGVRMQISSYDIWRRDALGQAIWIEAASDIGAAKARILHLAERFPAEYVVVHQPTASPVANFHFKRTEFRSLTHVAEESLSAS
jgi:hypothetical protein